MSNDILAFLDRVITAREEAALKTLDLADRAGVRRGRLPVPWIFTSNADSALGEIRDADLGILRVRATWLAEGNHITLNDPRSVLRRCAADRKLIELHQGVPNHGRFSEPECPADCDGQHDGPPVCMACRDYAGDPLNAPCLTVRVLAEGYGWTEGER